MNYIKEDDNKYIEQLVDILNDFTECCAKFFKIKTKDKKISPLVFRKGQERIWKAIKSQIDANKPIRIIILKARQVGCSTLCEAFVFWLTVLNPNTNTLILADEELRSKALFEMSKLFYKYLDSDIPGFKPRVSTSNRKELVFADLNSKFVIEMATKVKGGRTFTLHNVHSSETAFYRNADELFTATLPSMSYSPDTCFIMESTSSGYGGYFHTEWKRAVAGKSDFIPIFIAWYDWEDYELTAPKHFNLTNEEKLLVLKVQKYAGVKLTKDQLYWRRVTIRNMGKEGAINFMREFPSTPDEAFIAESTMYFPAELLELIEPQKPVVGQLYRAYTKVRPVIRFKEMAGGSFKLWHRPEKDTKGNYKNRYVIGVDTGSGTGKDPSTIEVVDKNHMRQCAEYVNNRVHSDQLADIVENTARYFNNALVAIELNRGEGIAVQDRLMETYTNIYYREQYDTGLRKITKVPGWSTTVRSRPIMLSRLREVIREALLEINSYELLEQLKCFRVIGGKPQAPPGEQDDLVIAQAIAIQLFDYVPELNYQNRVPEWWKDYLDEDSLTGYY